MYPNFACCVFYLIFSCPQEHRWFYSIIIFAPVCFPSKRVNTFRKLLAFIGRKSTILIGNKSKSSLPSEPSIFGFHPHGKFPIGIFTLLAANGNVFGPHLPFYIAQDRKETNKIH